MDRKMIIMLENEKTRYEFYMHSIHKSNIDNTIVRYELRYNVITNLITGASVSHGCRLLGKTLEQMIEKLLLDGFEIVTYETKKFA